MKLRSGDTVRVMTGKDAGKEAKIAGFACFVIGS